MLDKEFLKTVTIQTTVTYLRKILPPDSNVPTEEIESIANLTSLFLYPDKNINLHELMRKFSDSLVEFIVKNRIEFKQHEMLSVILKLFIIEWCYRNGHLNEDWQWKWDETSNKGEADIDPKIPLRDIPLP